LTKPKHLYALKLLFENPQNEFSPQILRDTLVALADPTPFDYYAKQSIARLELHLRTWVAVLEQVCFTQMRLSKELRDRIYNSLPKFAEIHRKTTQVMQEGIDNKYISILNQLNQLQIGKDDAIIKKRNYNIDFLLIHLRDTLHSLRDDETWFQEIIRRTKDLLKVSLNITPGILSLKGITLPNDSCSILSMLTQVRQSLSFKYPVASYYVDWRIMLMVQHNIVTWSESSEMVISKKFGELILMEYIWSFLEREWINVDNKTILDSQTKFDEVSDRVMKTLKNTGSFLNDLAGNEPLALPHTLWFGILDLAQNLIQKSTRIATYGLCYYLAIESLNKAPSSFIQFKAIEILLHLQNINNQEFSMIEIDFNQYSQKLNEVKLADSSEKFQNLLKFAKEKYLEDLKILNDDIGREKKEKGKEKSLDPNSYLLMAQKSTSNILGIIACEMTCPISSEPTNQLCILKCQHILSLDNLKKLKQKKCPECRVKIEEKDIRYLPQNSIYKNLYTKFSESGYILPSIKLEDSNQIMDNQYDSDDSDNSEVDLILTKKKKFMNSIKLNSNKSLQSIFFPRISRKQHPMYQNAIKELNEKNYEIAEHFCKEYLKVFPTSYTMRCILAFTYICLYNYEQAHLYLKEAITLKEKKPIAYFICGEIFFRQSNYDEAIYYLNKSLEYKAKMNNLYIILGNSNLLEAESYNYDEYYLSDALKNYSIALQNSPNNYLCIKNSAYIYERQKNYSKALEMLDKLLSINEDDSLILCYYGEILLKMTRYYNAIHFFSKANTVDPENIHNLNNRAIAYFNLQEYDKSLLDFNKIIQLNPLNGIAYYYKKFIYMELNRKLHIYKNLTYYQIRTMNNIMIDFTGLDLDFWSHLCKLKMDDNTFDKLGIINKFNKYMYKGKGNLNLLLFPSS
jgi:tetratricopeptide (TPR) repeat protein